MDFFCFSSKKALDARTETRVSQQTEGDFMCFSDDDQAMHQYYQAMHQDGIAASLQHAGSSEIAGAGDGPVVWLQVSPR